MSGSAPASDEESRVKTVFWTIADVTAGEVTYGRGNPCEGHEPQQHAFA